MDNSGKNIRRPLIRPVVRPVARPHVKPVVTRSSIAKQSVSGAVSEVKPKDAASEDVSRDTVSKPVSNHANKTSPSPATGRVVPPVVRPGARPVSRPVAAKTISGKAGDGSDKPEVDDASEFAKDNSSRISRTPVRSPSVRPVAGRVAIVPRPQGPKAPEARTLDTKVQASKPLVSRSLPSRPAVTRPMAVQSGTARKPVAQGPVVQDGSPVTQETEVKKSTPSKSSPSDFSPFDEPKEKVMVKTTEQEKHENVSSSRQRRIERMKRLRGGRRTDEHEYGGGGDYIRPEEQSSAHISDIDARGYAAASARRSNSDVPFDADPENYEPNYDWSSLGGPPPGIIAREISDEVMELVGITPERAYQDPRLPKASPPPAGSNYIDILEWIVSELDYDSRQGVFYGDSSDSYSRCALDMFCQKRSDIYRHYEQIARENQKRSVATSSSSFTP